MNGPARMSRVVALVCAMAVAVPLSLPADATPPARALPVTNGPLLFGDRLFNADVKVRSTARYRVVVSEQPDCRSATSAVVKVRSKPSKPHK